MPPYKEKFVVGTPIRIAALDRLEAFKRDWKYHHPLSDEQFAFAGRADRIKNVAFYHGGDVLYQLEAAPGTWHEQVLESL